MREDYEEVLEEFQDIISRQEIKHENFDNSELIEGKIEFVSGWRLEFMEFNSDKTHKYRFHLMDEEDELVKRWDTAPHHPELENFPFHLHTEDQVRPTEELKGKEMLRKVCRNVLEAI